MTNNSEKQDEKIQEELNWQNEADAQLNIAEWFGAIMRYFWHLGRRKFDAFYNQKELKKNAIIGWILQVFLIIILIYVGYRYSKSI